MATYMLTRELELTLAPDALFPFFANANNLKKITPPWLHFKILSPAPIVMKVGEEISYQLRLFGVPFLWTTVISVWDPPYRFVDEQLSGPYRRWVHEHVFEAVSRGTVVRDRVEYEAPGGRLVHSLFVKPSLKRIFDYRHAQMQKLNNT